MCKIFLIPLWIPFIVQSPVSGIYLFVGEDGGWIAFRNGMILLPITIGVCVVLIPVLMGLVYADKRRAVRVEREFAAIAGNQ